ncbi:tripartite tricarboxylate transporter substrate binding protein [Bordetella sp. N]|uniref:Bug family tripartite tricarboxylate transporter substrate binding protein n=1 Tax=Bordetella sp. N TaxID=1746199 RepID=UPI00070F218C|nr:tripartite tricarboxylate transporter substrate-binding protein [Bordetella sp. N]ALM86069.1 hypothetical protein ASB57_26730 [Bordetella sp. N]
MIRRDFLKRGAVAVAGWPLIQQDAWAQGLSSQPIRLVVPFSPGSATDNIARLLTREMQLALGQPIVVENRPGAQGTVGAEAVARSAPDGNTLLVASVSLAAAPSTLKSVPFDPVADFTTVGLFASTPLVLVARADMPATNVAALIAYARAHPGKISAGYGSSSSQVCAAQLIKVGGFDALLVPYKSIPLATNDLLGGTLQFTFLDLGSALAQVKSGRLRALAVTTAQRSPLAPDWPAMAESLRDFEPIDAWIGLMAPKGLPGPVTQRLYSAISRAVADADVKAKMALQGFAPALVAPEQAGGYVEAEVRKWSRLCRQAGIQPE